ncbi:hypothetical protein [Phycicoccus sp. 3266]|uniref:hypothetical protein n=1 Tax=Phycicoccus sp. 3266 TaxID=2817751 RepID=UPI00285DA7AB|nr:hypothetical protein [Phycicoccus sp. 3266]MDR6862685.1 hypothetical protein [Phycicoccus sp. 3266]
MSDYPVDPTATGRDEDLPEATERPTESSSESGADTPEAASRSEYDLTKGEDASGGTDGVGGGNDSRSSVLEDTLGAGGDPDEDDRGL